MKALTLYQPWTELVAAGVKRYETRSWSTTHRGLIAIHASARLSKVARREIIAAPAWRVLRALGDQRQYDDLRASAIIAVCDLIACIPTQDQRGKVPESERDCGDWRDGRWAWKLGNVRRLTEPVACGGARGIWTVDEEVEARVRARIPGAPVASAGDDLHSRIAP